MVDNSFKRTQDKKHPSAPRSISAKKRQGAFASSSSRFALPRDVVLNETDPANPGHILNPAVHVFQTMYSSRQKIEYN